MKEIKEIHHNYFCVSLGISLKCLRSFQKFGIRSIFISEEHPGSVCKKRNEKWVGIAGWMALGCGCLDRWYESGAMKDEVRSYFILLLAIVLLCSYFIGSIKLTRGKTHKLYDLAESGLIKAKILIVLILYAISQAAFCLLLCVEFVYRSALGLPTSHYRLTAALIILVFISQF